MIRRKLLTVALALAAVAGVSTIAGAAFTAPEPQFGQFSESDRATAIAHGEATRHLKGPNVETACVVDENGEPLRALPHGSPPPMRVLLNSEDDDGVHYAREPRAVPCLHHHNLALERRRRDAAAAKGALAKQWYADEAPPDANMDFDNLAALVTTLRDRLAQLRWGHAFGRRSRDRDRQLGFTDDDGDGSRLDEFAFFWQNWNGGWDNVIVVFQPADATGRANALIEKSRIIHYTDDSWMVWRHEMGHNFGSCDEYPGDGCNSCGICSGRYHITPHERQLPGRSVW